MSILAFLGGRHDTRGWGRALFAAGCRLPDKPDPKVYARVTDQIIRNDCKIITQSAHIILHTKNSELRSRRKMILFSRCSHLSRLEPYADRTQKKLIRDAKAEAAKARKVK